MCRFLGSVGTRFQKVVALPQKVFSLFELLVSAKSLDFSRAFSFAGSIGGRLMPKIPIRSVQASEAAAKVEAPVLLEADNAPLTRHYKLLAAGDKDLLAEVGTTNHTPTEAELIRLQSLLTQWLRMDNVAVLISAGCSYAQGGKLMTGLEAAVLKLLAQKYESGGNTSLAALIEERHAAGKESSFENWLSYLSNAAYLSTEATSPFAALLWKGATQVTVPELQTLLIDLRNSIYAYCMLELPEPLQKATGHHALMAKLLARDPSLGRANIFTTNYDTLIEQALDHLAVHYVDGFVGTIHRRFNPACYGLDMYYPGAVSEGRVRRYDKFLQLYKLHGSTHWRERDGGRVIEAQHTPSDSFVRWRSEQGESLDGFAALFNGQGTVPFGILPTANKFVQTLDLPYAHIFRAFHQALQRPQTFLLVLGYGFGDEHINRIVDDALANPSLVILVVEPRPRPELIERIKRYQQAGERAFLLVPTDPAAFASAATFDDFAINVLPNVEWLDDWLALKRMESVLKREGLGPEGGDAK
jgi:hypothetical protein